MVDTIIDVLEKGERAVCAIGAAHFVGEEGILSLLEAQGATISRISFAADDITSEQ